MKITATPDLVGKTIHFADGTYMRVLGYGAGHYMYQMNDWADDTFADAERAFQNELDVRIITHLI